MIKDTDQQAEKSFALSPSKTIGLTLALAFLSVPRFMHKTERTQPACGIRCAGREWRWQY